MGVYATVFDRFEHVAGGGVRFAHRLHFEADGQQRVVGVVQDFAPLAAQENARMSGFRRRVELDRVPSDAKAELLLLSGDVQQMDNGGFATINGSVRLEVAAGPDGHAKLVKTKRGASVIFDASTKPLACELEYRAEATVDQFHPLPPIDRSVARQELAVVPGFEAVRLPLTDQAMPTGLAWRPDGTLVVSSLEGRVWLGRDTDGDGLEDKLAPFGDELAAPFGVAASGRGDRRDRQIRPGADVGRRRRRPGRPHGAGRRRLGAHARLSRLGRRPAARRRGQLLRLAALPAGRSQRAAARPARHGDQARAPRSRPPTTRAAMRSSPWPAGCGFRKGSH